MFSFQEYVMFSVLSDAAKKELAEKFAQKLISPEEARTARAMGLSFVEIWAQKQVNA